MLQHNIQCIYGGPTCLHLFCKELFERQSEKIQYDTNSNYIPFVIEYGIFDESLWPREDDINETI
jgi:hypothetical protein